MVKGLCEAAKIASYKLLREDQSRIDQVLCFIADALLDYIEEILEANQKDLHRARAEGMEAVMQDRLMLTQERVESISRSVRDLAALRSPYEQEPVSWTLRNGLLVEKRQVPFGVVGMIYESRPNVTVDAVAIALKTGNAIVLKGGKEALETNRVLVAVMRSVLEGEQLPVEVIGFIDTADRAAAAELLGMKGLIDVLIPRGSAALINWVTEHAKVPVIETGAGNCHIYVDGEANLEMAVKIIENAKVQRPSVCNAVEKVLVTQSIAAEFLPLLVSRLGDKVVFRVDEQSRVYMPASESMCPEEYGVEYLDYVLGIRIVSGIEEAVAWINQYSTHHSDSIITQNKAVADLFQRLVDSAVVYHNASTRFTDGGEFGFGAEIGIATSKLHARGPMGLDAMTTYKYCVSGSGQIRA